MFPLVGTGKFITAPVITEDGTPTQDPIVLLEANPEKLMTPTTQATGNVCFLSHDTRFSIR